MKYEAEIEVEDETSQVYYEAIRHERPVRQERCKVEVCLDGNLLKLKFIARDFTALRAALHSYLRWLKVIEDMISVWREKDDEDSARSSTDINSVRTA